MESTVSVGKGSSYVGLKRVLEGALGIPVCVDDYRNTYTIQDKDGLLRSSFDGIAGFKGMKEKGMTYQELATATIVLTGEELPEDTALRTRCAVLRMSKENQGTRSDFNRLVAALPAMSTIVLKEITEKTEKKWDRLVKNIDRLTAEFYKRIDHQRQALIWAIPTAVYYTLLEEPSRGGISRVLEESSTEKVEREQEDIVADFFENMAVLMQQTKINEREHFYIAPEGFLYIWLKPVYNDWADILARKRRNPPGYGRLRTELEGKSWVIDLSVYLNKGLSGKHRCVQVDLTNMPIELARIFLEDE